MKDTIKNILNSALLLILISEVSYAMSKSVPAESTSVSSTTAPPNIVLVLADDMSWFDVGAYHQSIKNLPQNAITPNIDKSHKKA